MNRSSKSVVFVAIILTLMFALVFAQGSVANAQDSEPEPPKSALFKGAKKLQNGEQSSYCWSDGSSGLCADYASSYPNRAAKVSPGSIVKVRFYYPQRPEEVFITSHRKVDGDDYPVGDGRRLGYNLRPVSRDGRVVAWDALFTLKGADRKHYLGVSADWENNSRGVGGDSRYTFYVRTGR